eukprot:4812698-Pyramimonas_sp.AAC.1
MSINIEAIGRTLVRSAAMNEQVAKQGTDLPDESVIEEVERVKEKEKQRGIRRQEAGFSPEQFREVARPLKRDKDRVAAALHAFAGGRRRLDAQHYVE